MSFKCVFKKLNKVFFLNCHIKIFLWSDQLLQQLQVLHSLWVSVVLSLTGCQTAPDSAWSKPENGQCRTASPGNVSFCCSLSSHPHQQISNYVLESFLFAKQLSPYMDAICSSVPIFPVLRSNLCSECSASNILYKFSMLLHECSSGSPKKQVETNLSKNINLRLTANSKLSRGLNMRANGFCVCVALWWTDDLSRL